MSEWTLSELCIGKGSYGIGAPAVDYDENLPTYLRITDINDDGSLNTNGFKSVDDAESNKYTLKENDIVFARTGNSTGRSYFYNPSDGTFVYAGFLIKFSLDPTKVNPKILKYYTHSQPYYDWVKSFDTGATRGNINAQTYGDMTIELPERKVQDRIVSILSSLDAKIENNNKVNAKLEEIAQNLFKEWFVDFGPFKDGKFVDSELGPIPEGWRVGLFSDTVDVMPGGTPKTDVEEYWVNGNIPFFSPKDAGTDVYCVSTEKAITMSGLNACSSRLYPKNTIFITARGTVGKVVMAACDMAMNQSNYAIKPKDNNNYYYTFLQTRSITEKLKHKSNGAVFSAIVTRDFDECIIIPDKSTENQFNTLISPIFSQIWNALQENQRLATLRDTLLPKLMSGEIEV